MSTLSYSKLTNSLQAWENVRLFRQVESSLHSSVNIAYAISLDDDDDDALYIIVTSS